MILTVTPNPAIDKVYAIDDFAINQVFRPKDQVVTAGGKGLNVARVARLLGEEVMATGMIGGNNGLLIEKKIKDLGISSHFKTIQAESRTCLAVMDQKNNTSTEIMELGPEVNSHEYTDFLLMFSDLAEKAEIITASGSLPPGLDSNFYPELITMARKKGKRVIIDTSGKNLANAVRNLPYMIKPNLQELMDLTGLELKTIKDQAQAVLNFKKAGIYLPCLTLGKVGCLVALEDGVYHFNSPPVQVVNTVGSGDAFVAGCAVGLKRGLNLMETIKLGMACGTANTQFFQTGMISNDLVASYLKLINVKQVL